MSWSQAIKCLKVTSIGTVKSFQTVATFESAGTQRVASRLDRLFELLFQSLGTVDTRLTLLCSKRTSRPNSMGSEESGSSGSKNHGRANEGTGSVSLDLDHKGLKLVVVGESDLESTHSCNMVQLLWLLLVVDEWTISQLVAS